MNELNKSRLRGLRQLLHDGIEAGASAVERYHQRAADKPFQVLSAIPPIAAPTRVVRGVHDAILMVSYSSVRLVNRTTDRLDKRLVEFLCSAAD
jgi:hypothetical protein